MRGQLALEARECTLLTKTLRPPPDKHHGLGDTGTRYRYRELDLIANQETRDLFVDAQQDRARDPRMAGRTQLRRDRNARPSVARRRRRLAAVHDASQRAGPGPVPAHLRRAVPQPLHRRRDGERLRHGQGVPQRGHLAQALARVHDHRVHVRLLRLQRRRDRDRRNVPRHRAEGARTHEDQAERRGDRPRQAVEADHDARADHGALRLDFMESTREQLAEVLDEPIGPAGDLGRGRSRHLLGEDRVDDQPADPRLRLPARAVPDHAGRTRVTRSWPNTSTP